MTDDECLQLLRQLQSGGTSRNREYQRFQLAGPRRVLLGYKRVCSLLRDLGQPGVRASARWAGEPARLDLAVEVPGFRYRRRALLERWEARFLLGHAAAADLAAGFAALGGEP